jgi:hypothetical protein
MRHTVNVACVLGVLLGAAPGSGAEPAAPRDAAPRDAVRLAIGRLDAAEFDVRRQAALDLARLLGSQPAPELAAELAQALRRPDLSLEARQHLAPLAARSADPPGEPLSPVELAAELDRLASPQGVVRQAALARLWHSLEAPGGAYPAMVQLKQELADPSKSPAERRELIPLWRRARARWAASDPQTWQLPPVDEAQLASWLDQLCSATDDSYRSKIRARAARRELIELLCRDELVEQVTEAVARRLAATDDPRAQAYLRQVQNWARPALAAEIWLDQRAFGLGHRHAAIQYLLVGVPQFPEGGWRASHFDPVDEKTAHCVSGNNLLPGHDYPIGVAIPYPNQTDGFFHLVYLPTARRRVIYRESISRGEDLRLAEISQRTFDAWLAAGRAPTVEQLNLIPQLDSDVFSRFAGRYVQRLADSRLETSDGRTGDDTVYAALSRFLAVLGTPGALPSWQQALEDGRFSTASQSSSVLGWLALLAVARRNSGPESDQLLARLVPSQVPLALDVQPAPDVGATAAALLLARHRMSVHRFGLEPTAMNQDEEIIGAEPHRFDRSERRADVLRWWQDRSARPAPADRAAR